MRGPKIVVAISLAVLMANSTVTTAQAPTIIEPVPQNEFTAIEVGPKPTRVPLILDSFKEPIPSDRPNISQVAPEVRIILKSGPESKGPVVSGRRVNGLASYYCSPQAPVCANGYPVGTFAAAAGPQLRVAMGGGASVNAPQPWRGKTVHVCGPSGCAKVKLIDWCQCYYKRSNEKVIDLYKIVFDVVGASKGRVTISW